MHKLEKKIWNDADFDQMGWHDCTIYKIRISQNLEMDIDYILKWNKPDIEGMPFTFWIAPVTIVFKNIKKLTFEIDSAFDKGIRIQDIERIQTDNENNWTIITDQGDFEFISKGYEQFIRQEPFFEFGQTISFIKRNRVSLERQQIRQTPIGRVKIF